MGDSDKSKRSGEAVSDHLESLLERIGPGIGHYDDETQVLRVRLIVASSIVLALTSSAVLFLRLQIAPVHPLGMAASIGAVLGFAGIPWLLRRTHSVPVAGLTLLALLVMVVMVVSMVGGGFDTPVLFLVPVIPLLAGFFFGAGSARRTGVILLVCLSFLLLASYRGWTLPSQLWGLEKDLARALLVAFSVVIAAAFATLYEQQRYRARSHIKAREEMYRRLFEQSKDAVMLSEPGGKLIDVNEAGVELLEYPSKEALLEVNARELYVDPARRATLNQRLATDSFVQGMEAELMTFTKDIRVVEGTTTVIYDDDGLITSYLAILRDVTQARKIERSREAALSRLEARNEDLRHIHRAVSHDLKSPLFTLKGFLGLLERDLDEGDSESARADFEHVNTTADKMVHMVEELLDFARIERLEDKWRDVALGEMVDEVVALLEGRVRDAGATIDVAELPSAYGDPAYLRAIFQNLIENAVRFCADCEEPRIVVGTRSNVAETVFYIADNGLGISASDQKRVFELFQTAGAEQGRTGIGLATVKRAVELHGGKIWVESLGEGKGTTFFFTLPAEAPAKTL